MKIKLKNTTTCMNFSCSLKESLEQEANLKWIIQDRGVPCLHLHFITLKKYIRITVSNELQLQRTTQYISLHVRAPTKRLHKEPPPRHYRDALVRFVTCQQCCINRLHARGTGKTSHEPVINAFHMICVHTRQVPNWIVNHEFNHANYTLPVLLASIICSSGKMLN